MTNPRHTLCQKCETFLEWGLKESFSPREAVARGKTEA